MASYLLRWNIKSLNLLHSSLVTQVRAAAKYPSAQRVVASRDGMTVVCWHPEEEFPYEYSLPVEKSEKLDTNVLRIQKLSDVYGKQDVFQRQELMELTYTTKHRWFPENKHVRRRRRFVEQCRPYL